MIEFEMIASEYLRVWKLHAVAKWNAVMLDESKKSVLATEASKHDGSEAFRDRMARQSKAYKDFLKWWQQAIQKELELRHELTSLQMAFDYYRSKESTKRAEMSL